MRGNSRLIAMLLVVPFLVATLVMHGLALPSMAEGHPASCHGAAPAVPTPASHSPSTPSYQCCVMGHHWAIPGNVFSADRLIAGSMPGDAGHDSAASIALDRHDSVFVLSSVSPPLPVPLRI